jgi:uncharacterized protein YwgA
LVKLAGEPVAASFRIHHYGPFSYEIAEAMASLERLGHVTERYEPSGVFQTFQYVYKANPEREFPAEELRKSTYNCLWKLEKFTTPVLEAASTVGYFLKEEHLDRQSAFEQSRRMKPSLADPLIRKRVDEVLDLLRI